MKRRNVIDIIASFRTQHALREERERRNLRPAPDGPVISGSPDKNKDIFENEQVRVSTTSVPKGTEWLAPHDGRDRVVVLLDEINKVAKTNETGSSFSAWQTTWIPANSDFNIPNKSDRTKNLMILEFKATAVQQATSLRGDLIQRNDFLKAP